MAGRRTFFSFHFQRDIWRASNVRNANKVDAVARVPFFDASLWEEAKKKSDDAIKAMIDAALVGTSVTVVLIGAETASRRWVKYEIAQSVARGNGLLGVRIHGIKDQHGNTDVSGSVPDGVSKVVAWDRDTFGQAVEKAAIAAGKKCSPHGVAGCYYCS
jgi:hypothetical protein